ncbi:threonine/serine exporter family protein [Succinispira mobilis]|uniref:threonine/serine exporter family protein n=1 Tax=Succinispira mobilis TaxID=78120 RepID=UPI00036E86CC|nr:threonine/serine exporter family protein [Succinispira mobilis]
MVTQLTKEESIKVALLVGEILLKSGAETYRVEDTVKRICAVNGYHDIQPFVTPTLILIGDNSMDNKMSLVRINTRSINLERVAAINDFSYGYAACKLDFTETLLYLQGVAKQTGYKAQSHIWASGIGSAMFTVMLGGNWADFVASLMVGAIAMYCYQASERMYSSFFISNMLAGLVIGGLACIASSIYAICSVDKIIVGSVMPFVPGLAFTNGVRDFLSGDLIAGNSRIAEAIIIACSIAVGVGFMMKIFIILQGRL